MIDNLFGNDEDEPAGDDSGDDEMDGLFDEPSDGDLEDDDPLMGDDEMSFDGMDDDEGGATNSEMNNRIDELENEVASLSSSVNTVKSENEQISDSMEDVEENVRKLLEVYEMVTRGVNPFVNENELGDAFGGGGGGGMGGDDSLGLFDGDEREEDDGDVDDDIANADADAFFDDDLDEDLDDTDDMEGFEDDEMGFDEDVSADSNGFEDDEGDDFEFGDGDEGGFDDGSDDADEGGDDEGKSFEELKAEYDSGTAEWDGDETPDLTDDAEEGLEAVDGHEDDDTTETETDDGQTPGDRDSPGEKPYLESLPAGYETEMVVMDWLEYLVEEAGLDGAARTVAYYEAIEWLDERAAERLETFLQGFGEIPEDPEASSPLTVRHHNTSLRFISRIADPKPGLAAFERRTDRTADQQSATRRPRADRPASPQQTRPASPEFRADGYGTPSTGQYADPQRSVDQPAPSTRETDRASRWFEDTEPSDGSEHATQSDRVEDQR